MSGDEELRALERAVLESPDDALAVDRLARARERSTPPSRVLEGLRELVKITKSVGWRIHPLSLLTDQALVCESEGLIFVPASWADAIRATVAEGSVA